MEVKLDKRYAVAATVEQAWAVLSDIPATAACMPGAQITEQVGETRFKGTVKSQVGPATMLFNGEIELLGLDAARLELRLLGKGADKAGSAASMELAARVEPGDDAASSVLVGRATVVVSGRLAQFGSRLLGPVSDAMLGQFADNFSAAAAARPAAAAAAASPDLLPGLASAGSESTITLMVQAGQAPGATLPGRQAAAAPPPVKALNVFALGWIVVRNWIAGLFGRRR
jgi:hypothetical protein